MTDDDKEFVRGQLTHNRPDVQRLITLLIKAEAMREKAEFYKTHLDLSRIRRYVDCFEENGNPCSNERHDWSDDDWVKNTKKDLLNE